MFLDRMVGPLSDLKGRTWDAPTVLCLVQRRIEQYADLGFTRSDRVFLHHGNTLEFFVDLLAIWELGGCAVPVDGRLTPFEVEVLAGAAKPRFSVWKEEPESGLAKSLSALGVTLLTGWGEGDTSEARFSTPPGKRIHFPSWTESRAFDQVDQFRSSVHRVPRP